MLVMECAANNAKMVNNYATLFGVLLFMVPGIHRAGWSEWAGHRNSVVL